MPEFLLFALLTAVAVVGGVSVLARVLVPSAPSAEYVSLGLLASGGGMFLYGPIAFVGILTHGGDAAWWEAGLMVPIGAILIVLGARTAPEVNSS